MLDDSNILKQRDNGGALEVAAKLYQQANFDCQLRDAEHDGRKLRNIICSTTRYQFRSTSSRTTVCRITPITIP